MDPKPNNNQSIQNRIVAALGTIFVAIASLIVFMLNDSVRHWYYQHFTSTDVEITLLNGNTPVSGVEVIIDSNKKHSITNTDGRIIFENLSIGVHSYNGNYNGKLFSFSFKIPDTVRYIKLPAWNFNHSDSANHKPSHLFINAYSKHTINEKHVKISPDSTNSITKVVVKPPVSLGTEQPEPIVKYPLKIDSIKISIYRTSPQSFFNHFGIRINSMKKNESEANISLGTLDSNNDLKEFTENNFDVKPDVRVIKTSDDGVFCFIIEASEFDWKVFKSNCIFSIGIYKLK